MNFSFLNSKNTRIFFITHNKMINFIIYYIKYCFKFLQINEKNVSLFVKEFLIK